jgi:hypothetical protein
MRRDRGLYAIVAAYVAIALAASLLIGRGYLSDYVTTYVALWCRVAACMLAAVILRAAMVATRKDAATPLRRGLDEAVRVYPPQVLAGLLLFLAMIIFMGAFTSLKTQLPAVNGFWADQALADLDRALHLGHDPWRLLQPVLGHAGPTRVLEVIYGPIWAALLVTWLAWMCLFCPDDALRRRYLLTFLATWIVNGTVLAGAFLSGGPVYYAALVGEPGGFAELNAFLRDVSWGPFSAVESQAKLWAAHVGGASAMGAGISAFPSLHVSMAVLVMLSGWSMSRRVGAVLAVFLAAILVGSVHLGWHYAVDGYFAVASVMLFWRLSRPPPGETADRA